MLYFSFYVSYENLVVHASCKIALPELDSVPTLLLDMIMYCIGKEKTDIDCSRECIKTIKNLRSAVILRKYLDPFPRCRRQPISHQIPEPFQHCSNRLDELPQGRVVIVYGGLLSELIKSNTETRKC